MSSIEEYDAAEAAYKKAERRIFELSTIVAAGSYHLKFWQSMKGISQSVEGWPMASELPEAIESIRSAKANWIQVHNDLPESLRTKFSPAFSPPPPPERYPTR